MADYIHIENLIQGEVMRIFERRSPDQWEEQLEILVDFLGTQRQKVLIEKIKAAEQLQGKVGSEADPDPADESAPDDDGGEDILTPGVPAASARDGSPERQSSDNRVVGESTPDNE